MFINYAVDKVYCDTVTLTAASEATAAGRLIVAELLVAADVKQPRCLILGGRRKRLSAIVELQIKTNAFSLHLTMEHLATTQ